MCVYVAYFPKLYVYSVFVWNEGVLQTFILLCNPVLYNNEP